MIKTIKILRVSMGHALLGLSLSATLLLLLQGAAATAQPSGQYNGPMNAELQARLEVSLAQHKVAGASVAIWQHGQLSTAAAGVTNITTGVPITTNTVMHIGSITKVLNTTLIMQLVDEGLVDLDTRLITYLPDFTLKDRGAAEKITVKMLLNHTSGIDNGGTLGLNDETPNAQRVIDLVNQVPGMGQIHEPGRDLSYNNIGMVLAGYLAERLRGKSWYELIREYIYQPLEMHHAIAQPENALLHRASIGHTLHSETGQLVRVSAPFLSPNYAPAGATLMMSATDLVTFARTQMNEGLAPNGKRLLSAKSARLMRRETARYQGAANIYGLGWELYERSGLGHTGGGSGISSSLYIHPQTNTIVAILTNSAHGAVVINEILAPLFKKLDVPGQNTKARSLVKGAKDKPVDAAYFTGVYQSLGGQFIVKQRAGKLILSISSVRDHYKKTLSEVELWPAGNGYFSVSPEHSSAPGLYRFINPDDEGRMGHIATGARLYKRIE